MFALVGTSLHEKGNCYEVNPGTGRTLFGGKLLNVAFRKLNMYYKSI